MGGHMGLEPPLEPCGSSLRTSLSCSSEQTIGHCGSAAMLAKPADCAPAVVYRHDLGDAFVARGSVYCSAAQVPLVNHNHLCRCREQEHLNHHMVADFSEGIPPTPYRLVQIELGVRRGFTDGRCQLLKGHGCVTLSNLSSHLCLFRRRMEQLGDLDEKDRADQGTDGDNSDRWSLRRFGAGSMYERLVEFEHFNLASVDDVVHCRAAQNDHLATNDNHYGATDDHWPSGCAHRVPPAVLHDRMSERVQPTLRARQRVHGDTGSQQSRLGSLDRQRPNVRFRVRVCPKFGRHMASGGGAGLGSGRMHGNRACAGADPG